MLGEIGSDLLPEKITKLGMAISHVLKKDENRPQVVLGKDTRRSGYSFEPAMFSGLTWGGADVLLTGPVPISAVAMLTQSKGASLGIMLSAGSNTYEWSGVTLFGSNGQGLSEPELLAIEAEMESMALAQELFDPGATGRAWRIEDAEGRYIERVKQSLPHTCKFDDKRIVIDCAHGAAYKVGPALLQELGCKMPFDLISIASEPTGKNINHFCGVNHVDLTRSRVLDYRADAGIVLSGDGSQSILIDEEGAVIHSSVLSKILRSGRKKYDRIWDIDGLVTALRVLHHAYSQNKKLSELGL
jgi:phosphoglucosamine mutase